MAHLVSIDEPADPTVDSGLVRVRIDLAYDGTDFAGWAVQPGQRTVQGVLRDALAVICRLPKPPVVTCAGRTDAGVHAHGQVAHVDLPSQLVGGHLPHIGIAGLAASAAVSKLEFQLRAVLPRDVVLRSFAVAPEGFNARYSALSRRYRYRVCDAPANLDPWRRRDTLVYSRPLDLAAMNEAGAFLVGKHDFASFCRKRVGATTIRTLQEVRWERNPSDIAKLTIVADAFCHSMVRSLVGAMLTVGDGRREPEWVRDYLAGRERGPGVTVAAARGLVLEHVAYPPDEELAERARLTRARRT